MIQVSATLKLAPDGVTVSFSITPNVQLFMMKGIIGQRNYPTRQSTLECKPLIYNEFPFYHKSMLAPVLLYLFFTSLISVSPFSKLVRLFNVVIEICVKASLVKNP
jgi:hypothetical protein